jgi:hypothetical protein
VGLGDAHLPGLSVKTDLAFLPVEEIQVDLAAVGPRRHLPALPSLLVDDHEALGPYF